MTDIPPLRPEIRKLLESYGEPVEKVELQPDDLTVSRAMEQMGWSEKRARDRLNQMAKDGKVRRIDRKGVAETIYRPIADNPKV